MINELLADLTDPDLLASLCWRLEAGERRMLPSGLRVHVSQHDLDVLAALPEPEDRLEVTKHPNTSHATIWRLTGDGVHSVRHAAATVWCQRLDRFGYVDSPIGGYWVSPRDVPVGMRAAVNGPWDTARQTGPVGVMSWLMWHLEEDLDGEAKRIRRALVNRRGVR